MIKYIILVILAVTTTLKAETNLVFGRVQFGTVTTNICDTMYGGGVNGYINCGITSRVMRCEGSCLIGEALTNYITEAAADGTICRVLGHKWDTPTTWISPNAHIMQTLTAGQNITRSCCICGKLQTLKTITNWE